MRKITAGSLQPENDLGSVPEGKEEFLFKSLSDVMNLGWDLLVTERQRCGHLEGGNQGGEISPLHCFTIGI
jgi:hypothetical protein